MKIVNRRGGRTGSFSLRRRWFRLHTRSSLHRRRSRRPTDGRTRRGAPSTKAPTKGLAAGRRDGDEGGRASGGCVARMWVGWAKTEVGTVQMCSADSKRQPCSGVWLNRRVFRQHPTWGGVYASTRGVCVCVCMPNGATCHKFGRRAEQSSAVRACKQSRPAADTGGTRFHLGCIAPCGQRRRHKWAGVLLSGTTALWRTACRAEPARALVVRSEKVRLNGVRPRNKQDVGVDDACVAFFHFALPLLDRQHTHMHQTVTVQRYLASQVSVVPVHDATDCAVQTAALRTVDASWYMRRRDTATLLSHLSGQRHELQQAVWPSATCPS